MRFKLPSGFTSRPATLDDIPSAAKLMNDYEEHYLGYRGFSENDLETEWTMPRFDPKNDIRLVCNPVGELVGCCSRVDNHAEKHQPAHSVQIYCHGGAAEH